jgi:CheY-like chemotaxis protein
MKPEKVLLVEDNPDDIMLTRHAFRKGMKDADSYELDVVTDGEAAIQYLHAEKPPRFILLDLSLPLKNGFEVLRTIRLDPRLNQIPVIILTSSWNEQDRKRAFRLGASSFLRKPLNFRRFTDMMKQLLSYWSMCTKNDFKCF